MRSDTLAPDGGSAHALDHRRHLRLDPARSAATGGVTGGSARVVRSASSLGRLALVALSALCMMLLMAATAFATVPTPHTPASFDGSTISPAPGSAFTPYKAAVDEATGDIYVIDTGAGNDVVDRFSADGVYLSQLKGSDTASGHFNAGGADDIAVDNSGGPRQGTVYVITENASTIFAFDPQGNFLWQSNGNLQDTCGVGVDANGNVWTSDYFTGVQQRDPASGAPVGTAVQIGTSGCSIAFDSANNLFMNIYAGGVNKYDASAYTTSTPFETNASIDVAVDTSTGDVYTDRTHSIGMFNSAGTEDAGSPFDVIPGDTLSSVTTDGAHGHVYVADNTAKVVQMFDTPGAATPKPGARTGAASNITATSADLGGKVNAYGSSTTCEFEYATNDQFTGSSTQPCSAAVGSGTSEVPVGATLTGLTGGTTYYYRLLATNANGTITGSRASFQTTAQQWLLTVIPVGTGSVSADSGSISNCSTSGGTCSGPYTDGSTVTLTATVPAHSIVTWSGGGCSGHAVQCVVGPLHADTTVTATFTPIKHTVTVNKTGGGTVTSSPTGINCGATCSAQFNEADSVTLTAAAATNSTFTGWSGGGCSGTGTCVVTVNADTTVTATFAQNAPSATTGAASGVTQTAATLGGTVDPRGAATTCKFQYGTSTSYGSEAPCAAAPGSGSGGVAVSAALSGLTAGTTYHFRVVATNAGGTTNGADATFATTSTSPPGTARLLTATATVTRGTAPLKISCSGGTCTGKLTLTAKVKQGKKTKVITVGKASFNLAAGKSATLKVKLSSAAKKILAKSHKLKASVAGVGGKKSVMLKQPAKKKKKH